MDRKTKDGMKSVVKALTVAICCAGTVFAQGTTTAKKPAASAAAAKPKPATEQGSASKTTASKGNLPSKQTVEAFMRHTFGYDENLKWEVVEIKPGPDPALAEVSVAINTPQGQQLTKLYVTPDQKYAITGDFMPFGADPYAPARAELKKANGPAKGAANPSVTIVEFADLQCPSCKHAYPTVEKLLKEIPNSKLVFEQFPLTQIHKWAFEAAKYGECVNRQNKDAFWKFLDLVYQNQDSMQALSEADAAPKLKQYATEAGANAEEASKCTADSSVAAKIYASMELGKEMGVTGTPTLFVDGRKIGNVNGIPYEVLKSIVEFQAKNK